MRVYCTRGHDTRIRGRCTQGSCRACKEEDRRARQDRRQAELNDYKISIGCQRCGYKKHPRALDLHHTDPSAKLFSIASAVNYAEGRYWAEVAKCEVLCKNCHTEEHA